MRRFCSTPNYLVIIFTHPLQFQIHCIYCRHFSHVSLAIPTQNCCNQSNFRRILNEKCTKCSHKSVSFRLTKNRINKNDNSSEKCQIETFQQDFFFSFTVKVVSSFEQCVYIFFCKFVYFLFYS